MKTKESTGVSKRLLAALSLRHLHYFLTLARVLHFRLAAEELALTASALSTSIRETERLIGAQLFIRKGHQVTLSEIGAAILPIAEHLLNTAGNAMADMVHISQEHQQTVRIGLVPSVAHRILPLLRLLQRQHADLKFDFVDLPTRALINDVRSARVDFGIGAGDATAGLPMHRLLVDELVVVLRKDDPFCSARSVSWAQLDTRPVAHFLLGSVADLALGSPKAQEVIVKAAYRVSFTETLYSLISSDFCVGIVPRLTAEGLLGDELTWRPIVKPRIHRDIVLFETCHGPRTPAVDSCLAFLKEQAGQITDSPQQEEAS
ncbi:MULTISPECIES: LysR family transcriptional regulator [unclassified Pseudomonas]|uniref:LysR family transcriptional regulator n=1 Tax=unclassified Pseudomonas TaxID=196821 RepID=UPI0008393E27|nr:MULTISPECIES: LysR family transcriptional regulator [unclassified Pseudomonas]QIH10309.1 LysR family transcriptional regulator [Pseudomonas sp. BIOMIG1BAC]